MIKKIILLTFSLFCILGINAQQVPGSWNVIQMSATSFSDIQDTPSKVYYLSGGYLYSYDKDYSETTFYTPGTKISDSGISSIHYNSDKKYLLVVYNNCNLDLIYDNGKIVNLPEIKNANLSNAKTINNVTFGTDRIYVATTFGIVIFNDVDHHVIESGIFNQNIPYVFELGDNVVLIDASKNIKYSPKKERHNSIDAFKSAGTAAVVNNVFPISSVEFITVINKQLSKVAVSPSAGTSSVANIQNVGSGTEIRKYKDGFYVLDSNNIYFFDNLGNYKSKSTFDSSLAGQKLSFWTDLGETWLASNSGVGCYDISGSSASQLVARFFPETSKQTRTWFRTYHPNGNEVYFCEVGRSGIHPESGNWNSTIDFLVRTETYNWSNGHISPRYPLDNDNNQLTGGPGPILFDQDDPSFQYYANNFYGLYVIKDRKIHYVYDRDNSPLWRAWGTEIYDLDFDNYGNLWTVAWRSVEENDKSTPLAAKVLPKASLQLLKTNPEKLTELDANGQYKYWHQPKWVPGYVGSYDAKIKFSRTTDKGISSQGGWYPDIIGIDGKGTASLEDNTYQAYTAIIDQDGNVTLPQKYERISWIEEDKDGYFWIGTKAGVFVLKDFNQICDNSSNYLTCLRPKVARNDGTNYADYLLSSDLVMCIAVDPTNRKWIATATSGLYCVSPDGTQIIYEFNKDNSPLVSNVVTMVACDPNGNSVLIGTPEGQFVYNADSAPAKEDYSEVYAYPNPVRPDYNGWITVNGLMDNSLVKITDAQGNIIWQGRSEGGMAVWDGCDAAGNRVRSGVYLVMASQNSNGSSGVVTKIVVIN